MNANKKQSQTSNSEASKAQQAKLDQNLAFGTADKPEGFVTTWKNATHLWRARALLCILMALILAVMQPGGPGLYKAWAADGGLVAGGMNVSTQAEVTEPTWVEEQGTGLPVLQFPTNSRAHFYPNYSYAFELKNYRLASGTSNNLPVWGEAKTDNEWASVNGSSTTPGLVPTEGAAKKGTLILRNGATKENGYSETYVSGGPLPELPFWYIGYTPDNWTDPNPAFLSRGFDGLYNGAPLRVLSPFGENVYGTDQGTNPARVMAGIGGVPGTYDRNSYGASTTIDHYLYGTWVETADYAVHVFMPDALEAGESSDTYAAIGLKWDDSVDFATGVTKATGGSRYANLFETSKLSWIVHKYYKSGNDYVLGEETDTVAVGNKLLFGQIVNPAGFEDETYDPAFWNNKYLKDKPSTVATSTAVAVTPAVSISYYPGGGTVAAKAETSKAIPLVTGQSFKNASTTGWKLEISAEVPDGWRTVKTPGELGISAPKTEDGRDYQFKGWATSPGSSSVKYTGGESLADEKGLITTSYELHAVWANPDTTYYNVNFYDGEEKIAAASVAEGETVEEPDSSVTDKENYSFVGWYENPGLSVPFDFETKINEETNVYGKWQKGILDVTLDANGGTFSDGSSAKSAGTVKLRESFTLPTESSYKPTRSKYDFEGWYTEPGEGDGEKVESLAGVSDDIRLYAHWKQKISTYTVTLSADTTGVKDYLTDPTDPDYDAYTRVLHNVPEGTTIAKAFQDEYKMTLEEWFAGQMLESQRNPGWVYLSLLEDSFYFLGWRDDVKGIMSLDSEVTSDLHLTSEYDVEPAELVYVVTFDAGSDGAFPSGSQTATLLANSGETTVSSAVPEPVREGYAFDGWFTAGGKQVKTIQSAESGADPDSNGLMYVGADTTLVAHWSLAKHAVRFMDGDQDAIAGKQYGETQYITHGQTVAQPSNPSKTGLQFDGWYTAKSGGTQITFPQTINEDSIFYAHWSEAQTTYYDITFTLGTGAKWKDGSTNASKVVSVAENGALRANMIPETEPLSGYSGDVQLSKTLVSPVTGEDSYVLSYNPSPSISVTFDWNSGDASDLTATQTLTSGSYTVPTMADMPAGVQTAMDSGYRFIGWSEDEVDKDSATQTDYSADKYSVTSVTYDDLSAKGNTDVKYYAVWEPLIDVTAEPQSGVAEASVSPTAAQVQVKVGAVTGLDYTNGTAPLSFDFTASTTDAQKAAFTSWTGGRLANYTNNVLTVTPATLLLDEGKDQYAATTFTANYNVLFTVTFAVDSTAKWKDGTPEGVKSKTVVSGNSVTVSDLPTSSIEPATSVGYTGAIQWRVDPSTVTIPSEGNDVVVTSNITYTAYYDADPDKTITFHWNSGLVDAYDKQEVKQNNGTFNAPATPNANVVTAMSGYQFIGWSATQIAKDDATITGYNNGAGYAYTPLDYNLVTDGAEYYAVWEPLISVKAEVGSGTSNPKWTGTGTVQGGGTTTPAAQTATIKVGAVTGKVPSTVAGDEAKPGDAFSASYTAAEATTPAPGSHWNKWVTNGSLSSATSKSITVNASNLAKDTDKDQYTGTTFTAGFDKIYTVTFKLGTGAAWGAGANPDAGTGEVTKQFAHGESLARSAFPPVQAQSNLYEGDPTWTAVSPATAPAAPAAGASVTVTSDLVYEATYASVPQRTVTWDWNDGKGTKQENNITSGTDSAPTVVDATAQANVGSGYKFVGWAAAADRADKDSAKRANLGKYNVTASVPYASIPESGVTYYAIWEPLVTVSAKTDGTAGGFVKDESMASPAASTGTTSVGAVTGKAYGASTTSAADAATLSVKYTASPVDTSSTAKFASWSGGRLSGNTTSNPVTIKEESLAIDSAKDQYVDTEIVAAFTPVYTVTFALNADDSAVWDGTPTTTVKVAAGGKLTTADIPATKRKVEAGFVAQPTWESTDEANMPIPTTGQDRTITGDVTYTVKYAPAENKTVTFNWNNGSSPSASDKQTVTQNQGTFQPTETHNLAGYHQIGWAKGVPVDRDKATRNQYSSGGYDFSGVSYEDATNGEVYYAVWEKLIDVQAKTDGKTGAFVKLAGASGTGSAATSVTKVGAVSGQAFTTNSPGMSDGALLNVGYTATGNESDATFIKWSTSASSPKTAYTSTELADKDIAVTSARLDQDSVLDQYKSTTLTAQFDKIYTLEFHLGTGAEWADGSTASYKTIRKKTGESVSAGDVQATKPAEGYKDGRKISPDLPATMTASAQTKYTISYEPQTSTITYALAATDAEGNAISPTDYQLSSKSKNYVPYNYALTAADIPSLQKNVSGAWTNIATSNDDLRFTGNLTWSKAPATQPDLEAGGKVTGDVTYTAAPELQKLDVYVVVQNGTFADGSTSKKFPGVNYGAKTSQIAGLTTAVSGIAAKAGYDLSQKSWNVKVGSGTPSIVDADPTLVTTKVEPTERGEVVYTVTLQPQKYTVDFELNTENTLFNDAKLSGDTSVANVAHDSDVKTANSAFSLPTLEADGISAEKFKEKYLGTGSAALATANIVWTVKGDSTKTPVDPLTYKVTGATTFVGTPDLADVPITFKIENGIWSVGGNGDPVTGTTIKYGEDLSKLLPNTSGAVANPGYRQSQGSWSAGADVKSFDGSSSGNVYTYSFPKLNTVTIKIENGTFADGTTEFTIDNSKHDNIETDEANEIIAKMAGYTPQDGYLATGDWVGGSDPTDLSGSPKAINGTVYTYSLPQKATITFEIVNGTWSDGSSGPITMDIAANKSLADYASLAGYAVPSGMSPDAGYSSTGQWHQGGANGANTNDTLIPSLAKGDKTFTYVFPPKAAKYTVKVHLQNFDETANTVTSTYTEAEKTDDTGSYKTGDTVDRTTAETFAVNQGLLPNKDGFILVDETSTPAAGITLSGKDEDNVIDLYYDRRQFGVTYTWSVDADDQAKGFDPGVTLPTDTKKYYFGEKYDVAAVSQDGWKFDGWYEGTKLVASGPLARTMGTGDVTLSGKWSREPIKISFSIGTGMDGRGTLTDTKEGQNGVTSYTLTKGVGDKFSFPVTNSQREEFKFHQWTTEDKQDGASATVAKDITVTADMNNSRYYAWWVEKQYVTWQKDSEGVGGDYPSPVKQELTDESPVIKSYDDAALVQESAYDRDTKTPSKNHKPGYYFEGWYLDGVNKGVNPDVVGKTAAEASLSDSVDFIAHYEGLNHKLVIESGNWTLDPAYAAANLKVTDTESGAEVDRLYKTGETFKLPSAAELTWPGHTLLGFKVEATDTDGTTHYKKTEPAEGVAADLEEVAGAVKVISNNTTATSQLDENAPYVITATPVWSTDSATVSFVYTVDAPRGDGTTPDFTDYAYSKPAKYGDPFKGPIAQTARDTIPDDGANHGKPEGYNDCTYAITSTDGDKYVAGNLSNGTMDGWTFGKDGAIGNITVTCTYHVKRYDVNFAMDGGLATATGASISAPLVEGVATVQNQPYGTPLSTVLAKLKLAGYDGNEYTGAVKTWTADPTSMVASDGDYSKVKVGEQTPLAYASGNAREDVANLEGHYDYTVTELEKKKYKINLVVNGGTYDGQSYTTAAPLLLTGDAEYGSTVEEALKLDDSDKTNDLFDSAKLSANDSTTVLEWEKFAPDSKTQTVTSNLTLVANYKSSHVVTFKVVGSTWNTLATAGDSAYDTTDTIISLADGGTTLSFRVPDGKAIGARMPDVAKLAPATGYVSTGASWDATPHASLIVTKDGLEFTYTFPKGKFGYQVHKYYLKYDSSNYTYAIPGLNGSYNNPTGKWETVLSTDDAAKEFLTVLGAASLGSIAKANETGYDDALASGSTESITIQAEADGDLNNNVFNLYYHPKTITLDFSWTGTPPSGATVPADKSGYYNTLYEIRSADIPADADNKTFSGWTVPANTKVIKKGDTAETTAPAGGMAVSVGDKVVLTANTTLTGSWAVADRTVTYKIDPAIDTTPYIGAASNGTAEAGVLSIKVGTDTLSDYSSALTADVKDGQLAPSATYEISTDAIVPAVTATVGGTSKTYTYKDKYVFDGWTYHVGDGAETKVEDPSKVIVTGSDAYVFTAHFKLKTFTIRYVSGDYNEDLSGVEGETVFSDVKFGDQIKRPSGKNIGNTKGHTVGLKSEYGLKYQLNTNEYWNSDPSGFFFDPEDGEDVTGLETRAYEDVTFSPALVETQYPVYVYTNPDGTNYTTNPLFDQPVETIADVKLGDSIFAKALKSATPTSVEAQFDGWSVYASNSPTAEDNAAMLASAHSQAKGNWKGDFTLETAFGTAGATSSTQSLYVFANWKPNATDLVYHSNPIAAADATYTVSGLSQGGSVSVLSNAAIQNNSEYATFKAPAGYSFDGWNTEANNSGTSHAAGSTLTGLGALNANHLYAQWREHTYTIVWKDKDGNIIGSATKADQAWTASGNVDAPAAALATGGDEDTALIGWQVEGAEQSFAPDVAGGTLAAASKPAGDEGTVTMVPQFAGGVTLTYLAGEGAVFALGDGTGTGTSASETKAKTLEGNTAAEFDIDAKAAELIPTKPGYKFVGWSTDNQERNIVKTGTTAYRITQNAFLRAIYTPVRVPYKVERYYEQTAGSSDWKLGTAADGTDSYTRYAPTGIQIDALTQGYASADEDADKTPAPEIKTVDAGLTTYKGYEFVSASSNTNVTPKYVASETDKDIAVVKLYYKIKGYDIEYKYTWVDAADATGAVPSPASVTKVSGESYSFEGLPTPPEGYEFANGETKWQYETLNGVAASGNVDDSITVTGPTTVYLPLKIKTYTVEFAVDANSPYLSKWKGETPAQLTETVKHGKKPTLFDSVKDQVAPALDGSYSPTGWIDDAGNYENPADYVVTGDVKFTAGFALTNTVTFLGGEHPQKKFGDLFVKSTFNELSSPDYNVSDIQLVYKDSGEAADLGDIPAEPGYEFAGWTIVNLTDSEAMPLNKRTPKSPDWPFKGTTASNSYTLTAQWDASEQTVTFEPGDHADEAAAPVEAKGKTGESIAVPAAPAPAANYSFKHWEKVSGDAAAPGTLKPGEGATFDAPKVDTVYKAVYEAQKSDINITVSGTGTVDVVDVVKPKVPYEPNELVQTVTPTPGTGYSFEKWTKENSRGEFVDFTGDGSATVESDGVLKIKADEDGVLNDGNYRAVFAVSEYKVTFTNPNAAADKTQATGSYTLKYGNGSYWPAKYNQGIGSNANGNEIANLKGAEGATFDGWSYSYTLDGKEYTFENVGLNTLESVRSVPIVADTEFTAHWRYDPATLSFSKGDEETVPPTSGSVTGWPESAKKFVHDKVNLSAAGGTFTREGYDLVGWAEEEGGAKAYELDDDYVFQSASATLYPVWSKGQVEIRYHANYQQYDSGANPKDQVATDKVEFGANATAATAGDKGFNFAAENVASAKIDETGATGVPSETVELKYWSTSRDDSGGKVFPAGGEIAGSELEGDMDLFAIWQNKEFTISFDGGEGAVGSMDDIPVYYGQDATIPPVAFTNPDHSFLRWTIADAAPGQATASDSTGKGVAYTFKAKHDLVFLANWTKAADARFDISVQLKNPADDSNYKDIGGNSLNSTPLKGYSPVTDTAHFRLDGWYTNRSLESSRGANNPPQFAAGTSDVDSTIKQILERDAEDKADYASIWEDDAFTTQYAEDGSNPVIPLYAKITQTGYTVHYDLNEPADYTAVNDYSDEEFTIGASEYVRYSQESFPGYSFLGWVKSDSAPVGTFDSLEDAAASVTYGDMPGVAVPGGYSTATNGELDTRGTGFVSLHAAWTAHENEVNFFDYYAGDGASAEDAADNRFGDQVTDAIWTDRIAVSGVENMVENKTAHASNEDLVFKGWYVKKDGKTFDIDYGVTTVGDIAEEYGEDMGGGKYRLNLYALWQPGNARLIYEKGEAENTHGLTEGTNAFVPVRVTDNANAPWSITLTPPTPNARFTKAGYTHTGWKNALGETVTEVVFPRGSKENQSVFPVFTMNNYKAQFVYGAGGVDASDVKSAQNGSQDSLTTVAGQPWASEGGIFTDIGYASDPELPGYVFEGWYSTPTFVDDEGASTLVKPALTSEEEVSGVVTVKSLAEAQGNAAYADQDGATVMLYAKWRSNDYTVYYDLNGGYLGQSNSKDPLVIDDYQKAYPGLVPGLNLDRQHYTPTGWHLTGTYNGKKYDRRVEGITTYEELVAEYRLASGDKGTDIPASLTLQAAYDQTLRKVTFTVSDPAHAHLESNDIEGTGVTSYSYEIGEADGSLNGDGVTQLPIVKAVGNNAAYSSMGWYFGDAGDADKLIATEAPDSYRLPLNTKDNPNKGNSDGVSEGVVSGDHFADATYVAKIEGGMVGGTVKYWYAGTDGSFNGEGSFTEQEPKSWPVESVQDPDDYLGGGVKTGFTYSDREGDTLTVTAEEASNVVNLYFNRDSHNLKFRWVYEGDGPADPLSFPDDVPTYYGATVAVPDAPEEALQDALPDYRWIGWYDADPTADPGAKLLTASFTMPETDKTLYGYWKQAAYLVRFDGVYGSEADALSGGSVLGGDYTISKRGTGDGAIPVMADSTLAEAYEGFDVYERDLDTGMPDRPDAEIQVDFRKNVSAISWAYKMGDVVSTTADPTALKVTDNVTFYAIASMARGVTYVDGELDGQRIGTFGTVDGVTRVTGFTGSFDVRNYLYDDAVESAPSKAAGPLVPADEDSDNAGLPTGKPGYKFVGWSWQFHNGLVSASGSNVGADDPLHDLTPTSGSAVPANLSGNITFTAQWQKTSSLLVYDLNDAGAVKAKWLTDDYNDPDGYRYTTGAKVSPLPTSDDLERDGYTFAGWTWTDDEGVEHLYTDEFTMPGASRNHKTVLKAKWLMNDLTVNFVTSSPTMGSVLDPEDELPFSLKYGESLESIGSIDVEANPGFEFTNWAYLWVDMVSGDSVSGVTDDPTDESIKIGGNATFSAQFREQEGYTYGVVFRDAADAPADEANDDVAVDELTANEGVAPHAPTWADTYTRAFVKWTYTNNVGQVVDVTPETTVSALISAGVATDADGNLILRAVWQPKFEYKTVYVPFNAAYDEEEGKWVGEPKPELDADGSNKWIEEYSKQLVKADSNVAGTQVKSWFIDHPEYGTVEGDIPGYTFREDAAKDLTLAQRESDTDHEWLDWWSDDETYTLEDGGVTFFIPVVMQEKYKVKFDLNDQETYAAGEQLPASTDADLSDKDIRVFTTQDNIPELADVEEDKAPTRAGFNFGGWFNQQSDEDGNFVDDEREIVAKKAVSETMYGDLSVDKEGEWIEPTGTETEADGTIAKYITLYAQWIEKKHVIKYAVDEDSVGVEIKLYGDEGDFGTDELSEIIGAASADMFVEEGEGDSKTAVRSKDGQTHGAVARTNRGYEFVGWTVEDAEGANVDLDDVLGSENVSSADSSGSGSGSLVAQSAVGTQSVVGKVALRTAGVVRLAAMAGGTALGTMADGVLYTDKENVKPGVYAQGDLKGLFPGEDYDNGTDDPEAETITYYAQAVENQQVAAVLSPYGQFGDHSADTPWHRSTQPIGTYFGEEPSNGVWGVNAGSLPANNAYAYAGWKLVGWRVLSNTVSDTSSGTVDLTAADVITSEDDRANGIVVPAGGLTVEGVWEQDASSGGTSTPAATSYTAKVKGKTLSDGTKIPSGSVSVASGTKLTNSQIKGLLANSSGKTASKWTVSYTDANGIAHSKVSMTAAKLIKLLKSTPVYGNITMTPADGAKGTSYSKAAGSSSASSSGSSRSGGSGSSGGGVTRANAPSGSTGSTGRSAPQTGDLLGYAAAGLVATAMAAGFVVIVARRRSRRED